MKRPEIKNRDLAFREFSLSDCDYDKLLKDNKKLKKSLLRRKNQIKALQAQNCQLEKLASVGANGATIAHELNNPLTVICAEADEILEFFEEESHEFIEQSVLNIKNSALRIRRIIDHFQAKSSDTERKPWRQQNLSEIIGRSLELLAPQLKQKNIETLVDLPKNLPKIWGNRNKLESIFQNLFINAMDATSPNGNAQPKQISVKAKCIDGFVTITIRDTGCGIPEKIRNQIFRPFFTTKKSSGTGLGLAIVTKYVEEHNGEIRLNPEVECGTEFILKFPLERRNGQASKNSGR